MPSDIRWNKWVNGLVLTSTLGLLLWQTHRVGYFHYHVGAHQQADYPLAHKEHTQVIILGSSHAGLVYPDALGVPGSNLWHSGQDVFEVEHKCRILAEKLPRLELAVISVSYFSFVFDNAAQVAADGSLPREEIRLATYAAYPSWLPLGSDYATFLKGRLHTIVTKDHWQRALPDLFRWHLPTRIPARPSILRQPQIRNRSARTLDAAAEARVGQYRRIVPSMLREHPGLATDVRTAMVGAIRALQKHGVRVVLVTTPVWPRYTERFPAAWRQLMVDGLRTVVDQTQAEYFDYSASEAFVTTPTWFADADHLTAAGAWRLSARLRQDLARHSPQARKTRVDAVR